MDGAESRWTDAEVARLVDLRKTLSIPATARAIGRSVKAVNKKLKRMRDRAAGKLKPDPAKSWSEEQKAELRQWRGKMSATLIAERTGRKLKTVQLALVRYCGKLSDDDRNKRRTGWEGGKRKGKPSRTNPTTCHKTRARKSVYAAVADGRLKRQPCEVCGCDKVEAHHEDYSKQLNVIWLCGKHHKAADKAMAEAARQRVLPSQ